MLRARLVVAVVGLPLLAALIAAGEAAFAAAVGLLLAAAAYELMRAAMPQAGHPPAIAAAVAAALLVATARSTEDFRLWALLPALALVLAFVLSPRRSGPRPAAAWWLLAVLYVGVLGGHWPLLRDLDDGERWLIIAFAVTFATDTGAYAAGRLLGRHRMAPALSPGKTWEGTAGGLLLGAAAAVGAVALLNPREASVAAAIAIAAGLPVAAVAGDLLESAIKRRAGVKDTSHLLPGHGGLLDRMDSLLLTGPLLYWVVRWLAT